VAHSKKLWIICSQVAASLLNPSIRSIAKLVQWELAKRGGFEVNDKWWEHYPLAVLQNALMKLLWDFTVQTDKHLTHNRPDIICIDFVMKHYFLIDVAIPEIIEFLKRFLKKWQRYSDLKIEVQKLRSIRTPVAPVIIGSLGSIPKDLREQLQTLQIYHSNVISKIQKSVLLSSCHIYVTEH